MHCPGWGANIDFSLAVSSCCASAIASCTSLGSAPHHELNLRCVGVQPGARGGAAWGAWGAAARAAPLLVVRVDVLAPSRPLHLLQSDLEREIWREVEPDVDGRLDVLAGQRELGTYAAGEKGLQGSDQLG